ncbi:MAG TPA: bis(5'-nucleosyl)-tetraphosphatase (symmetrical) YqeK [Candidatus Binatia bacterium]|nr:bis(5'-nucleosyl)-tetraphosphatase (symmetrical) YqeK [Candidatus Binatia bacterium]
MTPVRLEDRVREHLGQEHRYEHSLRVAQCAEELALRHGADPRKARLSGLLHDLARLYSPERLIAESEARGLPIDEDERAHPVLLHARLGAALARELFGVEDDAVLSAIAKHTRGAPAMSALDKIVYLADSLEPGRTFAERGRLWDLALEDLDAAMLETQREGAERRARKAEERASAR